MIAPDPNKATHSICIPEHNIWIPLKLKGVFIRISNSLSLSYRVGDIPWIELTSTQEWNPHEDSFAEAEDHFEQGKQMIPLSLDHTMLPELTIQPSPDHLYESLQWNIEVASLTIMFSCSSSSLYDKVSRTFGIGITTAEQTVKTTNQLALRNAILPIHKRFRTEVAQLCYLRLGGPHGKFHTDTFFALIPSLMSCSMGQMFLNDLHFSKCYPMQQRSQASDTLLYFMQEIGIPSELHCDDAKELVEGMMSSNHQKCNKQCKFKVQTLARLCGA